MQNFKKLQLLLIILCLSLQAHSKLISQHNQDKKHAVTNPTGKNILGINSDKSNLRNQKSNDLLQQQILGKNNKTFLQNQSQNGVEGQNQYDKEDFYLWEEGVSNLAYDDFLTTKFVKNIEYLGAGYNVAYGNPLSTSSIDPGYRKLKAFEYHYQENKLDALSGDADYFLPDGMTLNTQTSCNVSFQSREISSMRDYQKNLSIGANLGYKGWGFKFKASFDYQQTKNYFAKEDTFIISTEANCDVHQLAVSSFNQPKWSKQLNAAFSQLISNPQDQDQYHQFFENFGTHVSENIKLGAKFGYLYEMSKSEVEQMKSLGLSLDVSGGGYGFSAGLETDYQKQSKEAFKSATKSWRSFSIGAPPDSENNGLEWASQVLDNPMPTSVKLIQWSDFLKEYKHGNTQFTEKELNVLRNAIIKHTNSYCSQFLKKNFIIDECEDLTQVKELIFNQNEDGLPNVQGNQLRSSINYNKEDGSQYKWVEWIDNQNIIDFATDSQGYIYTIQKNNKLYMYSPITEEWTQFDDGEYIKVSAAKGKLLVQKKDFTILLRETLLESNEWVVVQQQEVSNMVINEQGVIISLTKEDNQKYQSYYFFYGSLIAQFKEISNGLSLNNLAISNNQFISTGVQSYNTAQPGYKKHLEKRDTMFFMDLQNQGSFRLYSSNYYLIDDYNIISLCVADEGFLYLVKQAGEIQFVDINKQDIKKLQSVQQKGANFKGKKVQCHSTDQGPLIYALGEDGKIYKKTI